MERVLLRYQGPPGLVPGWSPGETRAVDAATAAQLRAQHPQAFGVADAEQRGHSCR